MESMLKTRLDRPSLAPHILPNSGTMVGVCTTLIGLVKVVELRNGPSHVDEYAALASLLFVTSAVSAYISIRHPGMPGVKRGAEIIADLCFLAGLVGIAVIGLFFAYEVI